MHERGVYPGPFGSEPDSQVLILLIGHLRAGLKIESIGGRRYGRLMQRLVGRLSYWVHKLGRDGLVQPGAKGMFERSETFESYWGKRLEIWNGRFNMVSPTSSRESSLAVGTSVVGSMNRQSVADSGYLTGVASVTNNMNQQSMAHSGHWTTDKRMGLNSTGSPIVTISQWGYSPREDIAHPEKSESVTITQPQIVQESQSYFRPSEFSDIEDPFFGVDFDAGAIGSDLFPSTSAGIAIFPSTKTNYNQQGFAQGDSGIAGLRDDDGLWAGGWAPEKRTLIEYPSLKDQEQRQRLEDKNKEIEDWMGSDYGDEGHAADYIGQAPRDLDEQYNSIAPVDDAVSIHENQLLEGQVYFNPNLLNEADSKLSSRPHQWNDPPSLPYITTTTLQPPTSNDAIMQWKREGDNISLISLAASWGTLRRGDSELSLPNHKQGKDGNFLNLIMSKIKEKDHSSSRLDQGLQQLAAIVRKPTDSKLKRTRNTQNIPSPSKQSTLGRLAPLFRTSSFGGRGYQA